jgi:hypothetical protein
LLFLAIFLDQRVEDPWNASFSSAERLAAHTFGSISAVYICSFLPAGLYFSNLNTFITAAMYTTKPQTNILLFQYDRKTLLGIRQKMASKYVTIAYLFNNNISGVAFEARNVTAVCQRIGGESYCEGNSVW